LSALGAACRLHHFRTADGVRLTCRSFGGPEGSPRVLVLPGFWRSGLSPRMRRLAVHLSDRYRPLVLDFRGHGSSRGLYRFGAREVGDLAFLLDRLQADDPAPIGLVGFSMGGNIALCAVGEDPARHAAVTSIIAVSSPVDPARLRPLFWDARLAGEVRLPEIWRVPRFLPPALVRGRPDPLRVIGNLAPVPLLLVHSTGDWLVPESDARALYDTARPPKELRFVDSGRHCHADALFRRLLAEVLGTLDAWLDATLGGD